MYKYKSSTCLVLWKMRNGKLAIAGDRRCTVEDSQSITMEFKKINKQNNILLGATGDFDLCNLLINREGFKIPECRTKNTYNYIFNIFKPALNEYLRYYYNVEKGHSLVLPLEREVELIIGIHSQGWSCVIGPTDNSSVFTEISTTQVPALPVSAGCGRIEATALANYVLMKQKYISKQDMKDIYKIVGKLNNGCDVNCDIMTED